MATNVHCSAVLLRLQVSMAHGAVKRYVLGGRDKAFRSSFVFVGYKGAVYSGIGQTTHLHLFPRLRMRGLYLHFHMRHFGAVLDKHKDNFFFHVFITVVFEIMNVDRRMLRN
jgi:hypothetical protein